MDQAWLEAAHSYNRMTEAQRYDYWSRLSPEQQSALTLALEAVRDQPASLPLAESTPVAVAQGSEAVKSAASSAPVTRQTARRQPGGRTLAGTFGIGCVGMILGILVTLAVEAALVSAGATFLAGLFGSPLSSSSSRPSSSSSPSSGTGTPTDSPLYRAPITGIDCLHPRNENERVECNMEWQKRKQREEWEAAHPGKTYTEFPTDTP